MTGRATRPVGAVDVRLLRRRLPANVIDDLIAGRRVPDRIDLGDTFDGPGTDIDREFARIVADIEEEYANPGDVYGRVFDQFRYQVLATDADEAKARQKAIIRMAAIAETDVTLAVREQYRKNMVRSTVITGWRRIIHPELSESGTCGLCVVAADRVYRTNELMALHERCKCEVLPVIAGVGDPGYRLNRDDLDRIYEASGGTGGELVITDPITGKRKHVSPGLKRTRVQLADHGELGPVLIDGEQHYRGPAEVARSQARDPKVSAAAQLASLEKSFAALLARAERGEDVDRPLNWQRNRIRQLEDVLS
jgi:hypothetical protein